MALPTPNPLFDMGPLYAGGKLYTYETGTNIPKTTWSDNTKTSPNTNPVILDSKGRAYVWIDASDGAYRFKLADANDVVLYTKDGIDAINRGDIPEPTLTSGIIRFEADGTGDVIIGTLNPEILDYYVGLRVTTTPLGANTVSNPTIILNDLYNVTIKKRDPGGAKVALSTADYNQSGPFDFEFDGTNFILLNPTETPPEVPDEIPPGTLMLFQQTTAPIGWTKATTHNNKTLRVVSGTAGSGGSIDFSTVFGRTSTDGHTLTTPQIPEHTHQTRGRRSGGPGPQRVHYSVGDYADTTDWFTTTPTGGNGSHSHNIDLRVQYVDIIIASKD